MKLLKEACKLENGLIHIYSGDGKGKTTAAIGVAVRFSNYCKNIIFCQFLKSEKSGELDALMSLNIQIIRPDIPQGFTWTLNDKERADVEKGNSDLFDKAVSLCKFNDRGLLVLDEIVGAFDKELIDRKKVINFLINKPPLLEIVMTGRNPHKDILERCDYITNMQKIKHPYDRNIRAREGIEK